VSTRYPGPARAAGIVQGVADKAQGIEHSSRAWVSTPGVDERHAEAHARWEAGLPARNQLERDVYREHENRIAVDAPAATEVRARLAEHAREIRSHGHELEAGQ
jgi:hypothetical protein